METQKEKREKRTLKKVFYALLIAFAIVSFWRGVWGLMDIYVYPNTPVMSFVLSIIIGVIILYLTENLIERLI